MSEHPIEGLMTTAMSSIQDMIDVNTIIGEPIETSNNIVIIPISKVSFGFAAGGSEFSGETIDEYSKKDKEEQIQYRLPFGGGSGAGVTINPIAFIVISQNNVKLLPVNHSSSIDKILDYIPDLIENKKQETQEILKQMKQNTKQQERIEKKQEKQTENIENTMKKIEQDKKKNNPNKSNTEYEFEYDDTNFHNDEFEDYEDE